MSSWYEEDVPCKLCDGMADAWCVSKYKHDICGTCADRVANYYNFAHSGSYLTWPNVPMGRSEPRRNVSESTRWKIHERDGYACLCCGSKNRLCIDHVVPLCDGGEDKKSNYQTLCRSCNSRKSGTTADYRK